MIEKLEKGLEHVEEDLKQAPGDAAPSTTGKGAKKVAKSVKKAKKVAKKASGKSNGSKSNEGKITLQDLASEAKITTASARRKLRDAELSREGRWSWDDGSSGLKAARKALGLEG